MKGRGPRSVILTIVGAKKSRQLRCDLLGDDQPGGGLGGWEEVQGGKLGRGRGLSFKGSPSYTLTLPLGFNGLETQGPGSRVSVEAECRHLVNLGRPAGKGGKPPKIHVAGLVRVPSTIEWVIDSVEWGTQIRDDHGARVQQQFTLALIQYRKPPKSPAKDARKKTPAKDATT